MKEDTKKRKLFNHAAYIQTKFGRFYLKEGIYEHCSLPAIEATLQL
jgi:hypothetical protein